MADVQTVRKKRTLIKFGVPNTTYTAQEGAATEWDLITATIGTDEDGNAITTDCFYCEWSNDFGTKAIQQEADGVLFPARIKMPYVEAVYNALKARTVRIYKNGKTDKGNIFVLNSSVDNYLEANKTLEFQVRLYEVK